MAKPGTRSTRGLVAIAALVVPLSAAAAEAAGDVPPAGAHAASGAAQAASAASSSGPSSGHTGGGQGGAGGGGPSRPTESELAVDLKGPYAIKQTRRIGGEALSGQVCTLNSDFAVTFETPPVTFQLKLKPQPVTARASAAVAMHGTWSYAYLLARAGESHDASGEYDVIEDLAARRLHLEMHGTDHVVFKGHDGLNKIDYAFDLVPTPDQPCP